MPAERWSTSVKWSIVRVREDALIKRLITRNARDIPRRAMSRARTKATARRMRELRSMRWPKSEAPAEAVAAAEAPCLLRALELREPQSEAASSAAASSQAPRSASESSCASSASPTARACDCSSSRRGMHASNSSNMSDSRERRVRAASRERSFLRSRFLQRNYSMRNVKAQPRVPEMKYLRARAVH